MTKPKIKKLDPVLILWQDTHTPSTPGWMTAQEHDEWSKQAGSKVVSIGFYISEDADFIHLVVSIGFYISEDADFIHLVGDMDADECEQVSYLRPIPLARGL